MGLLKTIFPPAKPDRYAAKVIRAIRRAGVTEDITFDPAEFRLTIGGDKKGSLNLRNMYQEYCSASPFKRGQFITRWGAITLQTRREPEALDKTRLLPRVRDRLYHELLHLHSDDYNFPTQPITEDLVVEIVCDYDASIQTLSRKTLDSWAISFDEALKIGRENLWRRSQEDFLALRKGLYRSPWQDNHDASRLFLHDLIWQLPVKGKHVAVVPNRDILLVTGSEDPEGLAELARFAREVLNHPRPLTGLPLILDGSTWKTYDPSEESPAYRPLRELIETQRAMAYSEQHAALTARHERTGQDVFVPKYNVMQNQDTGKLWSWTVWVEDVTDALMPEADQVSFGASGPDGKSVNLGFATWHAVRAAARDLMEPTDLYPPRFRVRSFPTKEQLAKMDLRTDPR